LEGMNRNANGNKSKICQLILNNKFELYYNKFILEL
jgi:hypothetical protein